MRHWLHRALDRRRSWRCPAAPMRAPWRRRPDLRRRLLRDQCGRCRRTCAPRVPPVRNAARSALSACRVSHRSRVVAARRIPHRSSRRAPDVQRSMWPPSPRARTGGAVVRARATTTTAGSSPVRSHRGRRRQPGPPAAAARLRIAERQQQVHSADRRSRADAGRASAAAKRPARPRQFRFGGGRVHAAQVGGQQAGCLSIDRNHRRSQRCGSSRHAAQVARKLWPSPKPVSRITKRGRPAQRCGRPLPARKTWRAWANAPPRGWYGSS